MASEKLSPVTVGNAAAYVPVSGDFELLGNRDLQTDTNFASQSYWKGVFVHFFKNRRAVVGLVIIAVIIVLAMNLVGSLLISALIIFPALSAMCLSNSFFKVTVVSSCLAVISTLCGILASILWGTPVGSTIVAAEVIVFAVCRIAGGHVHI